jgi:hypothetical protein
MPDMHTARPDNFTPHSILDIRSDKRTRTIILFLRLIAIVFFVPLFAGIPLTFRHTAGFDPVHLWSLGLSRFPGIVTFLVLAIVAFVVALVHEGLHGLVLKLYGAPSVQLGVDGVAPRSYDAEAFFPRRIGLVVATVPFFLVSTVAVAALLIVPDEWIGWVFLPAVMHNVMAASDFLAVAWLLGVKKDFLVSVLSDGWVAYAPGGKTRT